MIAKSCLTFSSCREALFDPGGRHSKLHLEASSAPSTEAPGVDQKGISQPLACLRCTSCAGENQGPREHQRIKPPEQESGRQSELATRSSRDAVLNVNVDDTDAYRNRVIKKFPPKRNFDTGLTDSGP